MAVQTFHQRLSEGNAIFVGDAPVVLAELRVNILDSDDGALVPVTANPAFDFHSDQHLLNR